MALPHAPATYATPPSLDLAMRVGEGFAAIALSCLAQLRANARAILVSDNPEAIHQARVAVRRLRAAFSLFGADITGEALAAFRPALRAVTAALAPARDLHVLLTRLADQPHGPELTGLLAHIRQRRDAATLAARTYLADPAFAALLADFERQLASVPAGDTPLSRFATALFRERRRKLRRAARHLERMEDDDRHHLRIRVKKLRYATAFFAPLDPTGAIARHAGVLERLQDCLGALNDMAVAEAGLPGLFDNLDEDAAARLSTVLATARQTVAPSRRRLLRRARTLLDREADAPALCLPDPAPAPATG